MLACAEYSPRRRSAAESAGGRRLHQDFIKPPKRASQADPPSRRHAAPRPISRTRPQASRQPHQAADRAGAARASPQAARTMRARLAKPTTFLQPLTGRYYL